MSSPTLDHAPTCPMDFELLLTRADDNHPLLEEGLPLEAAAEQPRPEAGASAEHLADMGGDPNSLPAQRWGVVAPEGPLGDRLLALVAPLCRLREEEQGAKPLIYRVRPGMDAVQAARWKDSVLRDEAVPETEQPRYLLLLGDLDQVSLELQQVLGSDCFVGRLAFPTDAGYEAYVDKVRRWKAPAARKARALFFTAHDGSNATTVGYRALVTPSLESCRKLWETGKLPAEQLTEVGGPESWSAQELLRQAALPQPSLLFTMSHGLGAPRGGWRSVQEQRARQGAMSLGGEGALEASALAHTPFLPGGIWFYLACYGAGTPARSAYYTWLARLREAGQFPGRLEPVLAALPREGERPFIAALPQAALANPEGPLAVVGHMDLAWTYSFQDLGRTARNRPSRFIGLLRSMMEGRRAGVGLSALLRFFNEANVELTALYDQEESARVAGRASPVSPAERAHLWMLRQDLAGYVLLGDPAVTLAVGQAKPSTSTMVEAVLSILGGQEGEKAIASKPSVEAMVEAVLAMLSGEESEKAIASRVGVSLRELRQWQRVYMEAGQAALAAFHGGGSPASAQPSWDPSLQAR